MGIQQDNIRYTVSPCFAQFDKILHLDESSPTTRTEQSRASTSGQCEPSKSNGEPKSGEGRRQGCCGCRMAPELKGRRHGRCGRRSSSAVLQRESEFSRLSLMPLHTHTHTHTHTPALDPADGRSTGTQTRHSLRSTSPRYRSPARLSIRPARRCCWPEHDLTTTLTISLPRAVSDPRATFSAAQSRRQRRTRLLGTPSHRTAAC